MKVRKMRMDYKPVIEMKGYARNAAETLYNIVAGAGDFLKRVSQSRAVRSGVLSVIYFGGQVNVLANNIYEKKPEQKPNATSKQMDSNSGRANPTSRDGILDKIWDYGTVDQRLRTEGTNHVDTILLFGPDYVVDLGRGVYVVGSDVLNLPGEAMRRAKAIKAEEGKSVSAGGEKKEDKSTREFLAETRVGSRIQLPATQIGGVTESRNPSSKDSKGPLEGILGFIGDTGRFLGQVVVVAAEGAGRYLRDGVGYVSENPLDATAKGLTTWGIIELLNDGGRSHHVAAEEQPPQQPPW